MNRPGVTLAEAVVALALGAVVCALAATTLASQQRVVESLTERSTQAEAVRTIAHVLQGEAGVLAAGDVRAVARDSLAARFFRGAAIVCATDPLGGIVVRHRGMRLAVALEDSVLVIHDDEERATRLLDARDVDVGCHALPGERLQRWLPEDPVAVGSLLLVFENGVYAVADRALRYRLGAAGRQPLTDERFSTAARVHDRGAGTFDVTLPPRDARLRTDTVRVRTGAGVE